MDLATIIGILGNIVSFCVFLAPLPTFYRIYKQKSTEGFQPMPYAVALFSCMMYLFYGNLKSKHSLLIITINAIGCGIESFYIIIFLIYTTRESRVSTLKLLIGFIASFGFIVMTTVLATTSGPFRVATFGWICAMFSVFVFVAPLSVMRMVIRTRSAEYLSFPLSLFLTLCAITWFIYGLLIRDYYVATPNVLGFIFGVSQMILYVIYKDNKRQETSDQMSSAITVVDP